MYQPPAAPSLASHAQYFRIGLEAGLCTPEEAREWALRVIGEMDAPPGEIIEVSWRKPLAHLIDDLHAVEGEADLRLACRWLLDKLAQALPAHNRQLRLATRQAMAVARAAGEMDVYVDFYGIDDRLQLALAGEYGSVAACRQAFEDALEAYLSAGA